MFRTPYKKVAIHTLVCFMAFAGTSWAQDEFEKWKKQEAEKYQQFIEQRDREFAEFLRKEWKQMGLFRGSVPDEKPKPVHIPVYSPPQQRVDDTLRAAPLAMPPPPVAASEAERASVSKPKVDPRVNNVTANLNFFGLPVSINYNEGLRTSLPGPVGKESISAFWSQLSAVEYAAVLLQAQHYKKQMNLNDWGYCLLLDALGQQIYRSRKEATLFAWFMLSKTGYDTRIGYNGEEVYLLISTSNKLYGVPYLSFEKLKRRYYLVSLSGPVKQGDQQIFTYEGAYPNATSGVSFRLPAPPAIDTASGSRDLRFSYGGRSYTVPVRYNKAMVRFFENYPQTEFELYFDSSPSNNAAASLAGSLRPLLQGKSEREAVNFLLRFVQTAFSYKTDPEQFGREKPLFPDETLYYEYSDCEDRAILFAYLVRSLTGLEVIGLDYPGHISAAVKFATNLPGDTVLSNGKRYLICDPTYTNADVGVCMPDLRSIQPRVISIALGPR